MHDASVERQRIVKARFHLGRGRRAREAGNPDLGAEEARRALALNPRDPWAFALLGQCLFRSPTARLRDARQALEQARALDPTNGYFVRLLLDVLYLQGDTRGRAELLTRAWWAGAPVERWLPDGPPRPRAGGMAAAADRRPEPSRTRQAGRQPVPA